MAISVDRIHHQYHKENVADFDFDVVEESKEFQKLSLTDVPQFPREESKEFQKLSLTDNMPPDQPQVPKKVVDDGGKQLEQKPVAARGNFCYTDLSEWFIPYTYSPCMDYANSLPDVVLIPDKTADGPSATPYTYSPLNTEWMVEIQEKLKDYVKSNPGLSSW